jgi:asparagine synthase (glutamine-hydrolysing)
MFLIAITKDEISQKFDSVGIEELKLNSFILTSIVDNFLSTRISEEKDYSIEESPFARSSNLHKNIFFKFNYNYLTNTFDIFKPTISGRPIYYHLNNKGEFFCSTHISMLRKAGVPINENLDVLSEFFVYRIVIPPNTLYRDIKQLCSGDHYLLKIVNEKCELKRLSSFNLPEKKQNLKSINDAVKELKRLLSQTLENLNLKKEDTIPLLSGGLDSSILCRLCQEILDINTSYSTGYPFENPEENNEKRYAISAAKLLNFNHHYYEATSSEYLRGFLEAISHSEQPLHHLQMICLHLLYKNGIPDNKKIVVEGWGAGGSFGNFRNYLFYKDKMPFRVLEKKPFQFILKTLPKISDLGEKSVEMLLKSSSNIPLSDSNHSIWYYHDYGDKDWVCKYFNVSQQNIIKNQYDSMKRFEGNSIYDLVATYSLLGDEDVTLSILSKIAEGNRKMLYVPFYDYNLLTYVLSIPWKLKLKKPENIVRKSLARQCNVPDEIINRPKTGFGIQSTRWSEKGGFFEPLIPLASKIFDEKEIHKMQSTNPKKAMTFWNILNYSIWKRLHIQNEPLEMLMEELNNVM